MKNMNAGTAGSGELTATLHTVLEAKRALALMKCDARLILQEGDR